MDKQKYSYLCHVYIALRSSLWLLINYFSQIITYRAPLSYFILHLILSKKQKQTSLFLFFTTKKTYLPRHNQEQRHWKNRGGRRTSGDNRHRVSQPCTGGEEGRQSLVDLWSGGRSAWREQDEREQRSSVGRKQTSSGRCLL